MAASAMRGYLHRYGVACGGNLVVFTTNDSGWRTAIDMAVAGVPVPAVVDVRDVVDDALPRALGPDTRVFLGAAVVGTRGRHGLTSVDVRGADGHVRRIAADALGVSGAWAPTLHLTAHQGHRPRWDDALHCFVPDQLADDLAVAGAARGQWSVAACMQDGVRAAHDTCAALGAPVAGSRPQTMAQACTSVAYWRVPGTTGKAFVDLQHDVTTDDIALAAQEGFTAVEHLKRYTTLGMGTDQGKTSNLLGLALMAEATGKTIADTGTTMFRPPYTPVTIGALAGTAVGAHLKPTRLSPSHVWAMQNGASFTEAGLWLRAQWYARAGEAGWRDAVDREALAVRAGVGVCDVSTLGKIEVLGADAAAFLDFIYTGMISSLAVGRIRYGLMLRDDGFVLDDGTVARLARDRFFITTTTVNAARVLQHLEFCHSVYQPHMDVAFVSMTDAWAQFSIAGPQARAVLMAMADAPDVLTNDALPHMAWTCATLAGHTARVYRLSFSGELAFEVGVPAPQGDAFIRAVMAAGVAHGMTPYGLEALGVLRIEKGHVTGAELNGQTTARDVGLAGLMSTKKDYIGRMMARRPALMAADRPILVGLRSQNTSIGFKPGAHLFDTGQPRMTAHDLGHVTSTCYSPHLGCEIGLGLLADGLGRMGHTLLAYDPVRERTTRVTVCHPVFVDPTGGRTRT
jgi:methylglutamate dehydrogenase subunit C